jgi:nitroreductase
MEVTMNPILEPIFQRRAVKVFDPVEIPQSLRGEILDAARVAPSSFNSQPYRLYWVETPPMKRIAAQLCFGQSPAETASALVVAVADIGSMDSTAQSELEWMRKNGFSSEKVAERERMAKIGKWIFAPGPFGIFGDLKWILFRLVNLWKIMGMPPVSRDDLFKWATKNTSLACQNLMIAGRSAWSEYLPDGGFRRPPVVQIPRIVTPVS